MNSGPTSQPSGVSRADVREDSDKGRSEMASKTTWSRSRALRFVATTVVAALSLTVIAGVLPNVVTAEARTDAPFQSRLAETAAAAKLATSEDAPLSASVATRSRTATVIAPVVVQTSTRKASTGSTAAPAPAADETAQAQSILAGYIAQYPILAGSSVSFGDASGYQAVAYYKSGRIVISPTHTASLSRIIGHEIWHIIDWRDNGVIDWGENVPPK